MKKKFFTLLAAAAFCGFGVANAQTDIAPGNVHTSALKQGSLYHITETATEDYIFAEGYDLKWGQTDTLANGVWCVKAETPASSMYPDFTFENKGKGELLGVDLSPYFDSKGTVTKFKAVLGFTDMVSWRFSSKYQNEMDTEANYLLSYPTSNAYMRDSVAVLTHDGTDVWVELIPAPAVGTPPAVTNTLIEANLHKAAPIVVTAEMFNTLFGSAKSAARTFNYIKPKIGDLETSPLKDAFIAKESGVDDYLTLRLGSDTTKVLRVDTTVYNSAGDPYLKYAYSTYAQYKNTANPIAKQHHFRMVYLPSVDSLIVNVEEVFKPVKGNNLNNYRTWGDAHVSDDIPSVIAEYHNIGQTTDGDDDTYLVVQNLTNTTYCLTVGDFPVQTHIGLGFTGCDTPDDQRTTLQGLFIIKNKAGKYLQVPIFTDSTAVGVNEYSAPQWVTLEANVDPNLMPSFQWVVEKVRNNDEKGVSPITITSREYGKDVSVATVQLYKNAAIDLWGGDVTTASFEEVAAEFRTDRELGYKAVPEDLAKVMNYSFNYLHSYKSDEYLSVKNDQNDSLIHVTTDADAFQLIPYHHSLNAKGEWSRTPRHFGYSGNLNATLKPGYIVDLYRTAYVLKVKEGSKLYNTNKVVVRDAEKRYAVSFADSTKSYIQPGDSAVFFFKLNNTKDGKNYYALVDTSTYTNANDPMYSVKAGVDDNNLWLKAQNFKEIRTSAFAIEQSEEPLYRRFNRLTDGSVGADSFYSGDDGTDNPDTLRFFRMNNPSEFLYEDANSVYSKGMGINFLGVKHFADFSEGSNVEERTALYVDTAFVNRPATRDAGFDTPKPQYLIGLGITIQTPETVRDSCGCEPEVNYPGYTRGRYLINATDSVYGVGANWASNWKPGYTPKNNAIHSKDNNKDGLNDYIWDTRWERLAFVEAIHLGDTLYILNGAEYDNAYITAAQLRADKRVRAINLGNNLHKDVVFSFRLIDNEKDIAYADQVQNFLIESETTDRDVVKGEMIAPMTGGWVKIQNGVPVISRGFYEQAITDAERFNVVKTSANPVSNEEVDVTSFNVVAGNGEITIQNAAGKTVVVSNILGQTVANTAITSDNFTIAAPKGIVVVAVQGEEAVKAIVK